MIQPLLGLSREDFIAIDEVHLIQSRCSCIWLNMAVNFRSYMSSDDFKDASARTKELHSALPRPPVIPRPQNRRPRFVFVPLHRVWTLLVEHIVPRVRVHVGMLVLLPQARSPHATNPPSRPRDGDHRVAEGGNGNRKATDERAHVERLEGAFRESERRAVLVLGLSWSIGALMHSIRGREGSMFTGRRAQADVAHADVDVAQRQARKDVFDSGLQRRT